MYPAFVVVASSLRRTLVRSIRFAAGVLPIMCNVKGKEMEQASKCAFQLYYLQVFNALPANKLQLICKLFFFFASIHKYTLAIAVIF